MFERFDKRAAGRIKSPTITVQKRGTLSLNAAAASMLVGGVERAPVPDELTVELLYDRDRKIVGVRKADEEHPNTYNLRKQKNSDSYLLAGKAFTQYYQIDTTESRRYTAKMYEDGIVGIALSDDYKTVTRGEEDEAEAGAP